MYWAAKINAAGKEIFCCDKQWHVSYISNGSNFLWKLKKYMLKKRKEY